MITRLSFSCVMALGLAAAPCSQAAVLGQTDDFQSGTSTQGWGGSSPNGLTGPTSRVDGGPNGSGDFYLEQSSAGWHLATNNGSQWSGDYLGEGITGVNLDINHLTGTDPVAIRVAITGPGGFWSSTNATPITTGAWNNYTFDLTTSDLVYVSGGTGVLNDTLSNVGKLLIRHDNGSTPTPPGQHPQHITVSVGFDNIQAIPEPSTAMLGIASIMGLAASRRRKKS